MAWQDTEAYRVWNLKMWIRSRGYVSYFQRNGRYDRWSHKFRIENLVSQLYSEYERSGVPLT